MTPLKDTCLTYEKLLLQLDERLGGPQKFQQNSEIPTKLRFHSLSFNTHQNEIPTPTPIENKAPLSMHVSIRMYLFINIYVFIYTHICVYVYISMFMYVYR